MILLQNMLSYEKQKTYSSTILKYQKEAKAQCRCMGLLYVQDSTWNQHKFHFDNSVYKKWVCLKSQQYRRVLPYIEICNGFKGEGLNYVGVLIVLSIACWGEEAYAAGGCSV